MSDVVASKKRELRERMLSALRGVAPAERDAAGARVAERILSLPEMAGPGPVMLFDSFGSEISTAAILDRLLAARRRVLLPYLAEGGRMEAAEFGPGDPMEATAYGPGEPSHREAVDPAEVAVVVAPGLAFDRSGRRLGRGGGHYDRFLERLGPGTVRIGVGFAFQVVDEVPSGPGDQLLDLVVTDASVIDCRGE